MRTYLLDSDSLEETVETVVRCREVKWDGVLMCLVSFPKLCGHSSITSGYLLWYCGLVCSLLDVVSGPSQPH